MFSAFVVILRQIHNPGSDLSDKVQDYVYADHGSTLNYEESVQVECTIDGKT